MSFIYILKLKNQNIYVGRSNDPAERYLQHVKGSGSGSMWTQLHPPEEILSIHPSSSPFDEDKFVKEMMSIYGIDKVRGGSYSKVDLDELTISFLSREIRGATDVCFRCGSNKHFIEKCPKERKEKLKEITCYRCKQPGHFATTCPKNKVVKKKTKKIRCYLCKDPNHLAPDCPGSSGSHKPQKQKQIQQDL